ncbi:MAG TPA: TonB-dependent receptor [Candidatus Acidoferrum sp.]|nr:TonB-dependent receptor [Candidatus Acidoferrum sp.]
MSSNCYRLSLAKILGAIAFAAVLAGGASAQTSSINGTVTDATSAIVPAAKVTAIDMQRNISRSTTTGATGAYSISDLPPSVYSVTVEKTGFREEQIAALKLTVDQELTLNVTLEVGGVQASVTVEGGGIAPINQTDAQVSTVIEQRQIESLPLILRDPYQLILLSPGSTSTDSGLLGFSIDGARERNNNFQLDGEDNNDAGVPASGLTILNPDNVQEFRVISNNYLPEYGRNSGSVVDIVTRSGTNQLHGDAYYFGRWNGFGGARDFFNPVGTPQNPYVRNTFGVSAGGPVIKDKAFFFFNYEANRFATTLTNAATVPDPGLLTGVFTVADPNSSATETIDVSHPNAANNATGLSLDPEVRHVLSTYPTSPIVFVPGVSDELFYPSPDLLNANNFTARADYNLTPASALSVRYVANHSNESNQSHLDTLPGIGGVSFLGLNQNWALHLTTAISPSMLNSFNFGALRANQSYGCQGDAAINGLGSTDVYGRGRDWGFPSLSAPDLSTAGCVAIGDTDAQHRWFGAYSEGDDITWIRGQHTTKLGIQFASEYTNDFDGFRSRSQPSFNNFTGNAASALKGLSFDPGPEVQDMVWVLLGALNTESQAQFFNNSGARQPNDLRHFHEHDFAAYWQDQFKLQPNFTLSYGLRYEWDGTPFETNDLFSQVTVAQAAGPAPISFHPVTRGGADQLYKNDPRGFEPRLGFAWDPFKTGKTSVRGGYGIFHDRLFFNLIGNARGNPPLDSTSVDRAFITRGAVAADQVSNTPVPVTVTPSGTIQQGSAIFPSLIDPNVHVAFVQDWNLGVQRDLGRGTVLEINYVGTKGNRLLRVLDGNAPIPSLVAQLRAYCQNPSNALGCTDGPTSTTVRGSNVYFGKERGLLPFDAVDNNAFYHANLNSSIAFSAYNGLQTSIAKKTASGLFFEASYTWAHSVDDSGDPLQPQPEELIYPANSFDLKAERGNSGFDVTNRLVANYGLNLPVGRGAARLNNRAVGRLLEGWTVSGITTLQTGFPFDVISLVDSQATGTTQRADYNPHGSLVPVISSLTQTGPNVGLFSEPPYGRGGNSGRNRFRGPGVDQWNLVLAKTTHVNERVSFELRTECYNLFNHPDFGQPIYIIEDGPFFGQSLNESQQNDGTTGARQLQVGLKLHF